MADIDGVFLSYGKAAYYAQLIEYDLVSIWMLDSITQGVSITRADLLRFQGHWSKRTLGELLYPLKRSPLLPDDLKQFLEDLRNTRNMLAHEFYLTVGNELRSPEGRHAAGLQLQQMTQVLIKGERLFHDVLTTYAKDFDIDYEETLKELMNG